MFEWFPILNGKYFTYQEYLFIFTIGTFSIISVFSFCLGYYLNRQKKQNAKFSKFQSLRMTSKLSDDFYENKTDVSSNSEGYTSVYAPDKEIYNVTVPKSGTRGGNAALWVAWFSLSLLPGSLATFHVLLPMWLAVILDYSIIMMRIRYKEKKDKMNLYAVLQQKDMIDSYEIKSRPIVNFYRKMVLWISVASIGLPIIFNNFCASAYQDYVGPIFGTASLSTQLTRFFQLSKACPPGPPCHLYATLPEDASTSVFINAHTDESYEVITIFYDLESSYNNTSRLRYSKDSVSFEITGMESDGKRRVHSFYLNNLQPDSRYYFQIYYDEEVQASNYYQTLPGEDNPRDMVIIQGGDMGDTSASRQVTIATGQLNPDVIILGGDLAYDNGMCTCYFAWDYLFRDLDEVNKQNGRLVPIVSAIGNHDAGLDSLNGKNLKVTTDGPFYMVFFPQHSSINQTIGVPALEERKSYHYHKFGKILLFNLDSGYFVYVGDEEDKQTLWMQSILDEHPSYLKFANYHCPIYFACKGHDSLSLDIIAAQRKEWLPIFDSYNFAIAFENHEHHLKRTHPLRNDAINSVGTLYIGNGEWGTDDSGDCGIYNQTKLYEITRNVHHFWMINVSYSQGVVENIAYGDDNKNVTSLVSQKLSDYMEII